MSFKLTLLLLSVLGAGSIALAQEQPQRQVAVKLNSLACIGIVNPALEIQLTDKVSLQMEGLGVFYLRHGVFGSDSPKNHIVMGATWLEGRYYSGKVMKGFYLGPNIGWSTFRLNKGIFPYYEKRSDSYQMGYNLMAGISAGYVWEINPHFGIDISWGGGYQCATYEAYLEPSGERVVPVNGSGEWMPLYKGGVSVIYKF